MSFSKAITTTAALTTIFGAAITGWKIVDMQGQSQNTETLQTEIKALKEELAKVKEPQVVPSPITLPQQAPQTQIQVPLATQLPPPPTPPANNETKDTTNP